MKTKQIMAAALAAGMLTFGAAAMAEAAGIGYVNMGNVMRGHPKYEKAQLDMKAAEAKAQQDVEKRVAGKSEDEQRQIVLDARKALSEKANALMGPIERDVQAAIEKTRQEKGLDVVLPIEVIVAGGEDITVDVGKKLAQ